MIDMIQDIACNVRENQVRALSIQPKIPEVSVGTSNGTDHFSLLWLEYSGPALKVVHFNWSGYFGQSVGPKCPFPFDKIVVPSTALLYPAYKNNNQTQSNEVPDYCLTNITFTEHCIFRELFIGNFLKTFSSLNHFVESILLGMTIMAWFLAVK